jgi:hypothetical protein
MGEGRGGGHLRDCFPASEMKRELAALQKDEGVLSFKVEEAKNE